MKTFLVVVGIITIILSTIVGIFSGSFLLFLVSVFGGVGGAALYFGIAMVLDNQENMLYLLHNSAPRLEFAKPKHECLKCLTPFDTNSCPKCGWQYSSKKCRACGSQYDGTRKTCPHCGEM